MSYLAYYQIIVCAYTYLNVLTGLCGLVACTHSRGIGETHGPGAAVEPLGLARGVGGLMRFWVFGISDGLKLASVIAREGEKAVLGVIPYSETVEGVFLGTSP